MAASMWFYGARCTLRGFSVFKHDKMKRKCILGSWMRSCSTRECSNQESNPSSIYGDKDPAPLFFNEQVQKLLLQITGMDLKKVYRTMKMKISDPKYQFVTDEELNKLVDNAKMKAKHKLQMPPVVKERTPITEIISYDPEIQGFENHTLIFTDISFGVSDRKRIILARDSDGTLRRASWEERDRSNQIFFPQKNKELHLPKMFLDEYLLDILNRQDYEFVLDRACNQFEPDDPTYTQLTKKVYEHIDKNGSYDNLRSTRHFGPMAFYFAFFKKMDNLLVYMIQNERLNDAVNLIQVYHCTYPTCKSAVMNISPQEELTFIRAYLDHDSAKRHHLELAIQTFEELQRQRQEYEHSVKIASANNSPSE